MFTIGPYPPSLTSFPVSQPVINPTTTQDRKYIWPPFVETSLTWPLPTEEPSQRHSSSRTTRGLLPEGVLRSFGRPRDAPPRCLPKVGVARSEERRVGKEGGS